MILDSFLNVPNRDETIEFPNDSMVTVNIHYSLPNKNRNSKTSLRFRIYTNYTLDSVRTAPDNGLSVDKWFISTTDTPVGPGDIRIKIKASDFGEFLLKNYVELFKKLQNDNVIYRKVDVHNSESLLWSSGVVSYSSRSVEEQLHRYTCSSSQVGLAGSDVFNEKTLSFLLYPVGQNAGDIRPGRLFLQGLAFDKISEVAKNTDLGLIAERLALGINFQVNGVDRLFLKPVVKVKSEYREVTVSQVGGFADLAGAKIKKKGA